MSNPTTGLSDPESIVREFQKRQKHVVIAALVCCALMIPLVMEARKVNPILSVAVFLVLALPMFGFYVWTFRCPACGTRVQQRRRMARLPIHCGQCGVLLDPR